MGWLFGSSSGGSERRDQSWWKRHGRRSSMNPNSITHVGFSRVGVVISSGRSRDVFAEGMTAAASHRHG